MSKCLLFILFGAIITRIQTDALPESNCLFQNSGGLFVLLDLKTKDPYWVQTPSKDQVFFSFCDSFTLPQCSLDQSRFGYFIENFSKQCFPLTSVHARNFETYYYYDESIGERVLDITYNKDITDDSNYYLKMRLICSEKQFEIIKSEVLGKQVQVTMRSVHGCPAYQPPALMQIIEEYELVVVIFSLLIGFLFLFYGRVMINITAYFSMATILLITLTFLCFRLLEQDVEEMYLYLTLAVIIISSFVIPYFTVKYIIKAALFFVGAEFGFFAGAFIKAFVLTYISDQTRLLSIANTVMNILVIAIMALLGVLTLEHKQYVIIYSSAMTGSYLIFRGLSLILGGFPCEFQLLDLIQSKQISKVPLSFYIYLIFIILLASLGGIYQELKLQKERKSGTTVYSMKSSVSRTVSGYIEGSLDQIHDQIERIIDRYRNSETERLGNSHINEDKQSQQMDCYERLKENERDKK